MKAKTILILFLALLSLAKYTKATNFGGIVTADTTWTLANSPYIITNSLTIPSGVTLTIQNGVQVQVNDNFGITVLGTLNANGVLITSSSSSPTPGKWSTFNIGDGSNPGTVNLTSSQVSYCSSINLNNGSFAGTSSSFSNFQNYGIFVNGTSQNAGSLTLNGSTFSNCGNACIYMYNNGNFTISNTNFSNSLSAFVFTGNNLGTCSLNGGIISGMSGTAAIEDNNPTAKFFSNLTINGNCVRGLYLNNGNISMTACTITSCLTPIEYYTPSNLVLTGSANNFIGNTNKYVKMNYAGLSNSMKLPSLNIPYYFPSGYHIYENGRLEFSDGNICKSGGSFNVYGKLIANASIGNRIYFTSFNDDNLGGDANGDGNATAPALNNWNGIYFQNPSIDSACFLRRVILKFAGNAVYLDKSSPTIDSCEFSNNNHGLYIINDSYPIVNGCLFGSSTLTPIAMTFDADPVFTGNIFSFQDNQYDAIGLIGSSLQANAVLKVRSVTSVSNVTYVLLGDITIPQGLSLTINKGVVIKSIPIYYRYKISVYGTLYAIGTADSNIIFTSVHDDNAGGPGDTNKNGTQTTPTKGDFGGIIFAPGSSTNSILSYCDIRYADIYSTNIANQNISNASVATVNASPTINQCKISNCNNGIVCYQVSNPIVSNNQLINCAITPIALSVSSNPVMTNNTFTNPGYFALGILGETMTASGVLVKRNLSTYTNITYVLLDNLYIANGTNLEIEAGVVIKLLEARSIYVDGGLKVNGNPNNRVVFTSVKDDNSGNPFDTNGDGNASIPTPNYNWQNTGYWGNINFNSTSDDNYSLLRSLDIKYAGHYNSYAVRWNSAAASMRDCNLLTGAGSALYFDGNSNPIVDSVVISNFTSDPISMSLLSDPSFTHISFFANSTRGIKIIDNNLSSNATLRKRSIAGISNIAYFINSLTIEASAILNIEPGVVIKSNVEWFSNFNVCIIVNGSIQAIGKSNEKIVFTSIRDDASGGDYNNDGNLSSPAKNDCNSILFNSSASSSNLKNCVFKYGGIYNTNKFPGYGAITLNSANISIDSCIIEQTNSPGISVLGSSNASISNTQFLNINHVPVALAMFSNPSFLNITLSNVRDIGLGVVAETYSKDGIFPVRNFGGYTNISYIGLGNYTINAGTTITIPAGLVFKGGTWVVNGKLFVQGMANAPVVFTCLADDNHGNPLDTRQDGNLIDPNTNNNGNYFGNGYGNFNDAIRFEDISNDSSTISNTIFRYYNTSIKMNSASPKIDSVLFQKSRYATYLQGVSEPIITNCNFNNLVYYDYICWWCNNVFSGYPLYTSILSFPSIYSDNLISGDKTYRGIGIIYESLSQDYTLTKRSFGGINNIPYIFSDYSIGTGANLTISPGVVCKFTANSRITVNRGLIAEGGQTADSSIVFTSIIDDFYGGDTNADSNATSLNPTNGDWNGITIDNQALNYLCKFKNVIIKAAYYGLNMTSKSPTVTQTMFKGNYEGIHLTGASNPITNYCDFIDNYNFGINNVDKTFTVDATNCWWGDNSGPTHSSNLNGVGDKISDNILYTPFKSNNTQNPTIGDVSLNGRVQAYDAALVMQNSVNLLSLNAIQTYVADVSGTSGVTAYDGSLILQYVVEKIRVFPAEELNKKGMTKENSNAEILIKQLDIEQNQLFSVPIQLVNVRNSQSIDLRFKYDASALEFINSNVGSFVNGLSFNQNYDTLNGIIYLSIASVDLLRESGDVVWLNFKSKSNFQGLTKLEAIKFLANETDNIINFKGGLINVSGSPTGITSYNNIQVAEPFPNPFSEQITIPVLMSKQGENLTIDIYSTVGNLVYSREYNHLGTGPANLIWDGTGTDGNKLNIGSFFIVIRSNDQKIYKKVTLTF